MQIINSRTKDLNLNPMILQMSACLSVTLSVFCLWCDSSWTIFPRVMKICRNVKCQAQLRFFFLKKIKRAFKFEIINHNKLDTQGNMHKMWKYDLFTTYVQWSEVIFLSEVYSSQHYEYYFYFKKATY